MKAIAALTICSFNYVSKALVLLDSYAEHHPDHSLNLVIVDRKRPNISFKNKTINLIWVEDLLVDNFHQHAFSFDIIEFNTNVKPMAMKLLLEKNDIVVYLDPDIQVFSKLTLAFETLETASVVITPHTNLPILDGNKPDDSDLLRFGSYNLGFVAVSKCDEANDFLSWWSDRCLKLGYYEPQLGLAVDQKWVDLAPSFFPKLTILHDLGYNVAFWNLHERSISKNNNRFFINDNIPLVFFHFSSFNVNELDTVAYKQSRFKRASRPDFTMVAEVYAKKLDQFKSEEYESQKYGFDYFDDGIYINTTLRRFYSILKDELFLNDNPFNPDSELRKFAIKNKLLKLKKESTKRLTFKDLNKYGKQEKILFFCLKAALYLLGPDKYFALMRYIAHISSIRNQKQMFIKNKV